MANPYEYRGSGQGFLTDYSGLAAAGSFAKSFADSYTQAQNDQQKRLEQQAQVEAMKSKVQREQFQSQLDAAKEGMSIGDDGKLAPGDLTVKQQAANTLTQNKTDAQAGLAGARLQQGQDRLDLQKDRFGETQSQNAAGAGNKIAEDPLMKDYATSRASLDRGRQLLNSSTPLTYNNMNAVQQDVINALTKGGQSSEGKVNREMQESWTGRWNNLMAKAGVYGPDNDIRKQDPGLAKQIGDLLEEIDSSTAKNQGERAKSLGNNYSQHSNQKVQKTVQNAVGQYFQPQKPQGLVPQGVMGQGLVPSGSAPAAPAGQDPDIAKYAKANNLDYQTALSIINARKAGPSAQ